MNPTYQHYATHDESEYPHLWRGVVGAWAPCLGPSGTRLHEHSGRANWGTLTNMDAATDWVVDGGQYALDFDGVNDFVVAGASGYLGLNVLTVSCWIRATGAQGNFKAVVGNYLNASWASWAINTHTYGDQRLKFYIYNGSSDFLVELTGAMNGDWRLLVGVATTSNVFGYVDGRLTGTNTRSGTIAYNSATAKFEIGAYDNSLWWAGRVSDVFVWSRALSANEIRELWEIGRGGMYTPRRRRRAYSFGPSFLAAWARGSNVILQPCGVS